MLTNTVSKDLPWCHPLPLGVDAEEGFTVEVDIERPHSLDEAVVEENVSVNNFESVASSSPYTGILRVR